MPRRRSRSWSRRSSVSRGRGESDERRGGDQAVAAPSRGSDPPSVAQPRAVQTARFLVRPVSFLERQRAELGETFRARLIGPGDLVFVTDPDSIKRLFGADRVNTIAPGRNLDPASAARTPIAAAAGGRRAPSPTQADAAALSRRAHARVRGDDRRGDRAGDRVVADRYRLPASSQHAGDHPRGDPARRVRRRGRRPARPASSRAGVDPEHLRLPCGGRPHGAGVAPAAALPPLLAPRRRRRSSCSRPRSPSVARTPRSSSARTSSRC